MFLCIFGVRFNFQIRVLSEVNIGENNNENYRATVPLKLGFVSLEDPSI
jgi:hypothetical protein